MPAAIFFVRLDLEKNSSFPDKHYIRTDFDLDCYKANEMVRLHFSVYFSINVSIYAADGLPANLSMGEIRCLK